MKHTPVMLNEVVDTIEQLKVHKGTVIDCTFGYGGYSKAILEKFPEIKIIAFDIDDSVIDRAVEIAEQFKNRFTFVNQNLSNALNYCIENNITDVIAIVADFGVSSMQIDTPERGFSFQKDGPLDMRMDQSNIGLNAFKIVNSFNQLELTHVIEKMGEDRRARAIAAAICTARSKKPITTTIELAKIVSDVYGPVGKKLSIHPATKTFQAIRIIVNNELASISSLLVSIASQGSSIMTRGARCIFVSFHGLEDGLVKNFCKECCDTKIATNKYEKFSKVERENPNDSRWFINITNSGPLRPSKSEVAANPRSRSAKLRIVELKQNF